MSHTDSIGNAVYAKQIQQFLSTGKVTRCPPGNAVDTEVFLAKHRLSVQNRLRISAAERSQ